MAGVVVQSRVVHCADPGMADQEVDDALGVVTVTLHPKRQRADAAQRQPGVEGAAG